MPELISPSKALAMQQGSSTKLMAELTEQKTEVIFQGHGFFIDNFGLLIPGTVQCEIIEEIRLCPIPHTQTWFHGMTNLRGGIVPVFDLQHMLGFSPTSKQTRKQKLLIINSNQDPLGILIDTLPKAVRFSPEHHLQTPPTPPGKLAAFCKNFFKTERIWIEWEINQFFESHTQRNVVQII